MSIGVRQSRKEAERRRQDLLRRISWYGSPHLNYADSGLWIYLNYVCTKDELDITHPVKPLPRFDGKILPHILTALYFMLKYRLLAIPKTRQIMISWMIAIFCTWFARTAPYRRIMVQSQKEGDAFDLVTRGSKLPDRGRMSFIEHHLPPWLQDRKIVGGVGNNTGELMYENGSLIVAKAQGADQARSHTSSLYVMDEAAFMDLFDDTFAAIKPAVAGVTGAGRFMAVSSAFPGGFEEMCLDFPGGEQPEAVYRLEPETPWLPDGMIDYTTLSNVKCLQIHHQADPRKDLETASGQQWLKGALAGYRGGMNSPKWRREMEIDWRASGGTMVFPFLKTNPGRIYQPQMVNFDIVMKEMRLFAGFDWGTLNESAFIVLGIDRDRKIHALYEIYIPAKKTGIRGLAEKIKACPYFPALRFIKADPSIWRMSPTSADEMRTVADIFHDCGVKLSAGRRGAADSMVVRLLNDYWYDPENPSFIVHSNVVNFRAELEQARYQEHVSRSVAARKNEPEKMVDKQNHLIDAAGYALDAMPRPIVERNVVIPEDSIASIVGDLESEELLQKFQAGYV